MPSGADIYVFNRVLHDWDDNSCGLLLQRCRSVMPATAVGGAVLAVISNVLHPALSFDPSQTVAVVAAHQHWQSIHLTFVVAAVLIAFAFTAFGQTLAPGAGQAIATFGALACQIGAGTLVVGSGSMASLERL